MKRFLKYWTPLFIWAGVIFFFSSLEGRAIPRIITGQEIIFHIFEYVILALLMNRALTHSKPASFGAAARLTLTIIACVIYAISDEIHQSFVPGRICSVMDLAFDSAGIVLGGIIYQIRQQKN